MAARFLEIEFGLARLHHRLIVGVVAAAVAGSRGRSRSVLPSSSSKWARRASCRKADWRQIARFAILPEDTDRYAVEDGVQHLPRLSQLGFGSMEFEQQQPGGADHLIDQV